MITSSFSLLSTLWNWKLQSNSSRISKIGTITNIQASPQLQQVIEQRPPTAKPKAPDEFDFKDEQVAKDYKKMYDKYQEMEAMLAEKMEEKDEDAEEDDDDEWILFKRLVIY